MNIVAKRYWYFGLSLLIIIPDKLALAVWGLPLAIDFTGGSLLVVEFEPGKVPQAGAVLAISDELGISDPLVQSAGETQILARSKSIDEGQVGSGGGDGERAGAASWANATTARNIRNAASKVFFSIRFSH